MKDFLNDEKTEKLIEDITLNVLNTGSKPVNFIIIKNLPTDINFIMNETGLTKVPVNKHVNELEKVGLLIRDKGTGKIYPTELTSLFEFLINEIEKHVKLHTFKMLSNYLTQINSSV